jgi:hypothetical protein
VDNIRKLNINLENSDQLVCEKCDCEFFQPVFRIQKVSALVSPTGQPMIVPIQLFGCANCGYVSEGTDK